MIGNSRKSSYRHSEWLYMATCAIRSLSAFLLGLSSSDGAIDSVVLL